MIKLICRIAMREPEKALIKLQLQLQVQVYTYAV